MLFPPSERSVHPAGRTGSAGNDDLLHAHGDSLCVWVSMDRSVARVHIAGELDVVSAPLLRAVLIPLSGYGRERVRVPVDGIVLLDLCATTALDPVGANVLSAGRAALLRHGWQVCITRPAVGSRRLLDQALQLGRIPADTWQYVDIPRCARR